MLKAVEPLQNPEKFASAGPETFMAQTARLAKNLKAENLYFKRQTLYDWRQKKWITAKNI